MQMEDMEKKLKQQLGIDLKLDRFEADIANDIINVQDLDLTLKDVGGLESVKKLLVCTYACLPFLGRGIPPGKPLQPTTKVSLSRGASALRWALTMLSHQVPNVFFWL